MSIIQGHAKGGLAPFYPKTINGSLRFNDDDSAYLSWTPDSAGDLKTWTFSAWVKRAQSTGSYQRIFACGDSTDNYSLYYHDTGNYLVSNIRISGSNYTVATAALYRDNSAWYHIVVEVDCVNSIHKLYVNGQQITAYQSTPTNPPNSNTNVGNTVTHYLGRNSESASHYFEGYLADTYFIDGQALDADDFGETKNGVWVAKNYAGTFGTNNNSFHLTFEDDTEVEAFNTVLWSGDSSLYRGITGVGFAPDFLWIKDRNTARGSILLDTIRGVGNYLRSDESTQESTSATVIQRTFDSDGFTLGNNAAVNNSNETYVGWCWKAGGTPTVDNSAGAGNVPTAGSVKIDGVNSTSALAGTIPATRISASDTYGFSIVSYTGTGSAATVGHGLSSAPKFIIVKNLDATTNWSVYHPDLTSGHNLNLDTDNNELNPTFGIVDVESGVTDKFRVEDGTRVGASADYIAYCWAEKSGYSKFGSYEGNNTATGPIIYTTDDGTAGGANGFKPAFVMIKNVDGTGSWNIFDNTRATFPDNDLFLRPDLPAAEVDGSEEGGDAYEVEFTDTGFIPKASGASSRSQVNGTGTYIYAAFADTREAAFWLDQSGNDNDWQPVNLDHNDTVADSPTNNFCTLNPLDNYYLGATFSDGNLRVATNNYTYTTTTMGMTSGQYYAEVLFESNAAAQMLCGITRVPSTGTSDYLGNKDGHISYYNINGNKYINGAASVAYGDTYTVGDLIGIAVDMDAGEITFFKNGTSQGVITGAIDTSATYFFAGGDFSGANNNTMVWNFGQQPFKYDPPA